MTEGQLDALLRELGIQRIQSSNGNLRALCPFHNESRPSWGISILEPHFHNCYSCGAKGTVLDLLIRLKGVSILDARRRLNMGQAIGTLPLIQTKAEVSAKLEESLLFMFKRGKAVYRFCAERGISEETAKKARLLFDPKLKRVLFPWRLNGEFTALTGRSLDRNDPVKTLPYFDSLKGTGLYSPRASIKGKRLTLLEGEADALKVFDSGIHNVAALGYATMTDGQRDLILKAGVEEVITFFDDDETGERLSRVVAKKLNPYVVVKKVSYVGLRNKYPNAKKLDPCELSHRHIRNRIKNYAEADSLNL